MIELKMYLCIIVLHKVQKYVNKLVRSIVSQTILVLINISKKNKNREK